MDDKIVIYETSDGETSIEVKLEGETVWLSANQMALLFDRYVLILLSEVCYMQ